MDASLMTRQSMCLARGSESETEKFLSQCAACRLYGTDVARIYIKEGTDGLGSRLHEIIAGMAIAARMRMALGGVIVGKKTCQQSHGLKILEAAGSFFGIEDTRQMFLQEIPHMDQSYPNFGNFEKNMEKYGRPGKTNIFLPGHCLACELDDSGNASSWYTPMLLSKLRKAFVRNDPYYRQPRFRKPGSTFIAIHARRGDVDPNDNSTVGNRTRGTTDEWYFHIIKQLRTLVPDADIHVFSSMEDHWEANDFRGYLKRNVTIHLDGDTTEVWAHFAAADVLVTAKSSFSFVPAFLNDKCVVYQPHMHKPLDGWVVAQEVDAKPLSDAAQKELKGCIESKAPAARRGSDKAAPPQELAKGTQGKGKAAPPQDLAKGTEKKGKAAPAQDLAKGTEGKDKAAPPPQPAKGTQGKGKAAPPPQLAKGTEGKGKAAPPQKLAKGNWQVGRSCNCGQTVTELVLAHLNPDLCAEACQGTPGCVAFAIWTSAATFKNMCRLFDTPCEVDDGRQPCNSFTRSVDVH
jgi:hypothetical protein